MQLVNETSDVVYALYLNDMCTTTPQKAAETFYRNTLGKNVERIVFCVNVGISDNVVRISGLPLGGTGAVEGSHYAAGVFYVQESILYYGNSLGWAIAQEF